MCKQCKCEDCSFPGDGCILEPKAKNVPRVHADCIKAWADGAEIQSYEVRLGNWVDQKNPHFFLDKRYRVKPKEKVKKWRYVIRLIGTDRLVVSGNYYSSGDEFNTKVPDFLAVEKIQCTMKEFDSD